MRDFRELDGGACADDEQPCGSTGGASSDSASNWEIKSKKKFSSPNGYASSRENSWTEVQYQRKKTIKQKKSSIPRISKRKSVEERQVKNEDVPSIASEESEEFSDPEDQQVGPSTSTDLGFGYSDDIVPWATKGYYPLSLDGLHDEIIDCYQWLRPTRLETTLRYRVFEKVRDQLRTKLEDFWCSPVSVSVFGSLCTGLFLSSSDIDILVECSIWQDEEAIKNAMERATEMLHEMDKQDVTLIPCSFVPIIKLVDRDTKINIDISFNTTQGVKAATYIEKVKWEFPVLEPLLLILKQFIYQNKINESYKGGLSSYGVTLLLTAFLQNHAHDHRGKLPSEPGVNMGYLLLRFLEVYGHELNYQEVGLDPLTNQYRKRSSCSSTRCPPSSTGGVCMNGIDGGGGGGPSPPPPSTESHLFDMEISAVPQGKPVLLSVRDPLQADNEVCRSSFNIYTVRTLFQSALSQLRGTLFVNDRPGSRLWRSKVYKGSMMGRLLNFSPSQISSRNWLKGFVLNQSWEPRDQKNVLYGSMLSAPSDFSCLADIPKAGKNVLEITRPDDYVEKKTNTTVAKTTKDQRSFHDEKKLKEQDSIVPIVVQQYPPVTYHQQHPLQYHPHHNGYGGYGNGRRANSFVDRRYTGGWKKNGWKDQRSYGDGGYKRYTDERTNSDIMMNSTVMDREGGGGDGGKNDEEGRGGMMKSRSSDMIYNQNGRHTPVLQQYSNGAYTPHGSNHSINTINTMISYPCPPLPPPVSTVHFVPLNTVPPTPVTFTLAPPLPCTGSIVNPLPSSSVVTIPDATPSKSEAPSTVSSNDGDTVPEVTTPDMVVPSRSSTPSEPTVSATVTAATVPTSTVTTAVSSTSAVTVATTPTSMTSSPHGSIGRSGGLRRTGERSSGRGEVYKPPAARRQAAASANATPTKTKESTS